MHKQEIIKDIVRFAVANHLNDGEQIDREELWKHTRVLKERYGISYNQLTELTDEALTLEGWYSAVAGLLSEEVDDLFDQFLAVDIVDRVLDQYASEYFREDLIELRDRINNWFESAIESAEAV